ncbi:hypothetical protein ACK8HX_08955 [Oryzobacter sp. R7]|uniref:hypothetical protein n=1 Tax=Oryzobacter faecalis TaxID=3388656 RepID=UPI00398D484D
MSRSSAAVPPPPRRGGRAPGPATAYRLGLLVALGTATFLVLGAGALGIIGDGRADRAYLAVLAVLVVGALLARLRARSMVVVMAAAAVTQVLVPVVLLASGADGTSGVSLLDVAGLTLMYAGLFTLAAWLFRRAGGAGPAVALHGRVTH